MTCCPNPPPHSSLMSMCAAPVQTLAGVLGLSSRPAQCSKCSGDRFCPGGSRVSPRVPKVPADTTTLGGGKGGRRCSRRGRSRGTKGNVKRASRCTPEQQKLRGAASTHGSAEGRHGNVRVGFDGTEDGTCPTRCWTVLVWPHMPSLNRRLPPPPTPISPPNASASSQPAQTGQIEGQ